MATEKVPEKFSGAEHKLSEVFLDDFDQLVRYAKIDDFLSEREVNFIKNKFLDIMRTTPETKDKTSFLKDTPRLFARFIDKIILNDRSTYESYIELLEDDESAEIDFSLISFLHNLIDHFPEKSNKIIIFLATISLKLDWFASYGSCLNFKIIINKFRYFHESLCGCYNTHGDFPEEFFEFDKNSNTIKLSNLQKLLYHDDDNSLNKFMEALIRTIPNISFTIFNENIDTPLYQKFLSHFQKIKKFPEESKESLTEEDDEAPDTPLSKYLQEIKNTSKCKKGYFVATLETIEEKEETDSNSSEQEVESDKSVSLKFPNFSRLTREDDDDVVEVSARFTELRYSSPSSAKSVSDLSISSSKDSDIKTPIARSDISFFNTTRSSDSSEIQDGSSLSQSSRKTVVCEDTDYVRELFPPREQQSVGELLRSVYCRFDHFGRDRRSSEEVSLDGRNFSFDDSDSAVASDSRTLAGHDYE